MTCFYGMRKNGAFVRLQSDTSIDNDLSVTHYLHANNQHDCGKSKTKINVLVADQVVDLVCRDYNKNKNIKHNKKDENIIFKISKDHDVAVEISPNYVKNICHGMNSCYSIKSTLPHFAGKERKERESVEVKHFMREVEKKVRSRNKLAMFKIGLKRACGLDRSL